MEEKLSGDRSYYETLPEKRLYSRIYSLIYASSIGTLPDMSTSPVDNYLTEDQAQAPIMNSPTEVPQNSKDASVIGGAVGGSLAVIIIAVLIAVVVLLVRKQQRLETGMVFNKVVLRWLREL